MRRLLVLYKHLPPEAASVTKRTQGWTDAQELRAVQAEIAHGLYRATLAAAGSKHVPPQLKIPRPKMPKRPRRPATDEETLAFFSPHSGR